ncbi:hypothetical protein SAY87_015206 [Trapa incisa]|uniref:Uncharacterized protein n=2 Tax=Trapa TaxID=22665 RepID=A0AAN7MAR1_TRANT|nr:hypothetical protein SAY87_015206 [Trapa incisa]KAK4802485.1 hypothetical protein SAY86_000688 [Trapa natans]
MSKKRETEENLIFSNEDLRFTPTRMNISDEIKLIVFPFSTHHNQSNNIWKLKQKHGKLSIKNLEPMNGWKKSSTSRHPKLISGLIQMLSPLSLAAGPIR